MGKLTVLNEWHSEFKPEFAQFIEDNLEKRYIPQYYPITGFKWDFSILEDYSDVFVLPELLGITYTCVRRQPEDIPFEVWANNINPIMNWVRKVTERVLYPDRMINTTIHTDRVKLRICVSELNKLTLPAHVKDLLFTNLIEIYYARKKVFEDYFFKKILGVPF